jgi:hypothetical protein
MTEQGKDTPLVNTLEEMAKAPTAFERALDDWSRRAPGSELASLAMHRMVIALAQELADEREIVRGQAETIDDLRMAVASIRDANAMRDAALVALSRTIEKLRPCPELPDLSTLQVGTAAPTMRVRLQHSNTIKEGHRLAETTVEWAGPYAPDWPLIKRHLREAFEFGTEEAALRNAPPVADEGTGL